VLGTNLRVVFWCKF